MHITDFFRSEVKTKEICCIFVVIKFLKMQIITIKNLSCLGFGVSVTSSGGVSIHPNQSPFRFFIL